MNKKVVSLALVLMLGGFLAACEGGGTGGTGGTDGASPSPGASPAESPSPLTSPSP